MGQVLPHLEISVRDPGTGHLRNTLLQVITRGEGLSIRWDEPTDRPLEPMDEYQQKVVQLRRRGLTHLARGGDIITLLLELIEQSHATIIPEG